MDEEIIPYNQCFPPEYHPNGKVKPSPVIFKDEQKCKFCNSIMDEKCSDRIDYIVTEEFFVCPKCGATYNYSFGKEIWMTKEQQEEYDEYMEQRPKQVQSNNESCDELPW